MFYDIRNIGVVPESIPEEPKRTTDVFNWLVQPKPKVLLSFTDPNEPE